MVPALQIDNLRKTYPGGVEALKGVCLQIEQGDFFGLLGPNGAGKSTLIGLVSTLVQKSSGDISVFGTDLYQAPIKAKSMMGIVPQEFNFNMFETPLNILVNQAGYYGIPRKLALQRAEKYLTKLMLWDKKDSQSKTLSGGMKRRLMIARALVNEPKLIFLDEPTAGVDIEIRRSMWEFLTDLNDHGITIILTTHYLDEAESLCKNIAIIDHGNVIEYGQTKSLLSKLQTETFVLDLARPLDSLPEIPNLEIRRRDATTLEIDVDKNKNLNDVFSQLSSAKLDVVSMRNKSNRLEELFLRLTHQHRTND